MNKVILTPEQMHAMVRAFTAHHMENAKDEAISVRVYRCRGLH